MSDRPVPPVAAVVVALLCLLTAVAGCTGGDSPRDAASSLPSRSVRPGPTLQAKPAPLEVTVADVAGGRLRGEQRRRLERRITRMLETYVDAAFLGRYPRSDFHGAFATFTGAAARQARKDRGLLTNAAVGGDLETVVPRRQSARLYVLRPFGRSVGLTARVRLVLDELHRDGERRRTTVKGRLVMKSNVPGAWKVFAYDVARSSRPLGDQPAKQGGAS